MLHLILGLILFILAISIIFWIVELIIQFIEDFLNFIGEVIEGLWNLITDIFFMFLVILVIGFLVIGFLLSMNRYVVRERPEESWWQSVEEPSNEVEEPSNEITGWRGNNFSWESHLGLDNMYTAGYGSSSDFNDRWRSRISEHLEQVAGVVHDPLPEPDVESLETPEVTQTDNITTLEKIDKKNTEEQLEKGRRRILLQKQLEKEKKWKAEGGRLRGLNNTKGGDGEIFKIRRPNLAKRISGQLEYEEMKVSQLKELLKKRGKKISGNKSELIERLREGK